MSFSLLPFPFISPSSHLYIRAYLDELFVGSNGALEVRHVVVAVTEEGKGRAGTGEVIQLKLEDGGGTGRGLGGKYGGR